MKACYTIKLDSYRIAILDVCRYGKDQMITRINVPVKFRGQRIASRLLDEACKDADADGIDLYLGISPSNGLNYSQLKAFYSRRGFVREGDSCWYHRRPKQ